MSRFIQIYVELLNEGIEVWRPIKAELLHDNIYYIIPQEYHKDEYWQFEPGDKVYCKTVNTPDGPILAATEKVNES